jgi:signal transduction histidine kinase
MTGIRIRLTARARLTLLYAALFTLSGAGLAALIIALAFPPATVVPKTPAVAGKPVAKAGDAAWQNAVAVKEQARRELRAELVTNAALAIGVMTVVSGGLGWLMAGRVLRPVHVVSDTARRLSEQNLDERIPVSGPHDEMRELAETFNNMLTRLESAFESQRRFSANASHELRGPMTTQRTLVEVAAAAPGASQDVQELARDLITVLRRQERTVEGLLALASGEHGTTTITAVRLDLLARNSLAGHAPEITAGDLDIEARLRPTTVPGDPTLLELLVDNLIRNAVRHNLPGGKIWVETGEHVITVRNTGEPMTSQRLLTLIEPYRRGKQDRVNDGAGVGLGLTIIDAVARAHGAQLDLSPRPGGGVQATVTHRAVIDSTGDLADRVSVALGDPPAPH